jgi:hypothetical protein
MPFTAGEHSWLIPVLKNSEIFWAKENGPAFRRAVPPYLAEPRLLTLSQQPLYLLFNHVLRHVAHNLIGNFAVLEEKQRGNAANPIA